MHCRCIFEHDRPGDDGCCENRRRRRLHPRLRHENGRSPQHEMEYDYAKCVKQIEFPKLRPGSIQWWYRQLHRKTYRHHSGNSGRMEAYYTRKRKAVFRRSDWKFQSKTSFLRLTITPKLKLSDEARKALLSCILKLRCPGMRCMTKSTHIMLEPTTQAGILSMNRSEHTYSFRLTNTTHTGHDPSSSIIFETHLCHLSCG